MSRELKSFLTSQGIATSRTMPYSPQGTGQIERYNGIIWRTIQLALTSNKMKMEQWEEVLQSALHSIHSPLFTAADATPHEWMFSHPTRSYNGNSLPTRLTYPGQVLIKKHIHASRYDPLVEEVDLIEANPDYAYVKLADGRETTVSTHHLAPRGDPMIYPVQGVESHKTSQFGQHAPLQTTEQLTGDQEEQEVLSEYSKDRSLRDSPQHPMHQKYPLLIYLIM
jgi:hypothetical protein